MKKTKRIFAILLSLAMILTMSIAMSATAFAADPAPAYDESLTISGLDNGDVANFYKVIEWVGDAEGNVAGWKATSAFASVLTEAKLKEVLVGTKADPNATPPVEKKDPTGITSELAGQLAKLATANPDFTATAASNKVTVDTTATDKGPGLYMALITPADADTVYNPVFVGADYNKDKSGDHEVKKDAVDYSDKSAAKKSKIELNKTASATEDNWDDKTWKTAAIGDTVSFTVTTKIPGYGATYTNPVFKVTDKLTDLKLKADTVTLTAPTGLTKGIDYTVTTSDSGYTVSFSAAYLKTCKTPTDVTITYDAIVTTTAPVHVNLEKNEVSTEFSHNPKDESDHGFKKDTTQHYTFTLDAGGLGCTTAEHGEKTSEIVKVGRDAQGNPITEEVETSEITSTEEWESPLAGAKFKLYTDKDATNEYVPKKADGTEGTAVEYVTGADGRMTITGLDAGTYYLQESEAPAGFIRDTAIHKIEIAAEFEDVDVTEYTTDGNTWISESEYNKLGADAKKAYKSYTFNTNVLKKYTVKIDGEETATYNFTNDGTKSEIDWTTNPPVEKPFDIINTQGTELPSTGGIGTIIFYTLGTLLVIGCGIVLVSRRRMQKDR